jgi:hypothetical protein
LTVFSACPRCFHINFSGGTWHLHAWCRYRCRPLFTLRMHHNRPCGY